MVRTIHEAAEEIRAGRLTPLDLLNECLAQIDRLEDKVHAWVFVDRARARAQAEERTRELKEGKYRGPLHGIPIGVKDIFDVFDWPTAAGSKLWANSIARQDAVVVSRLRAAGAVFIGKTVTTQYASFDPPVTRNPWDLSRTPGGSSSGSAAALACGMCLGATASQTGGSITRPAAYCGVAGLKPTYTSVDLQGIVPLAPSMDHPGPMARCVRDLALLLEVIMSSSDEAGRVHQALDKTDSPPRFARIRGFFDDRAHPAVREMMENVCVKLQEQGAIIDDISLPVVFAEIVSLHRTIMAVEAAEYHKERLQRHPQDYDPEIRKLLEEGLRIPATEYARSKQRRFEIDLEIPVPVGHLDALLTPATTMPAPDSSTTGNPAFNSPWSYSGHPTLTIPAAWTPDGLPLGIQLIGAKFFEGKLLGVAAWCEKALAFEHRTVKL